MGIAVSKHVKYQQINIHIQGKKYLSVLFKNHSKV